MAAQLQVECNDGGSHTRVFVTYSGETEMRYNITAALE